MPEQLDQIVNLTEHSDQRIQLVSLSSFLRLLIAAAAAAATLLASR